MMNKGFAALSAVKRAILKEGFLDIIVVTSVSNSAID